MNISFSKALRYVIQFFIVIVISACSENKPPIKVAILHSVTGLTGISEQPVANATMLAIEEINSMGGVLGRKIEAVIVDGRFSAAEVTSKARELIEDEQVAAIFGCWTSVCRKAVRPVVEELDSLLFYPTHYEGLESSDNIIYLGAATNQQLLPAVSWFYNTVGPKFFLVGSDFIFPHAANSIVKAHLHALGGQVVGEAYIGEDSLAEDSLFAEIERASPDIILNSLVGFSNIDFLNRLRKEGTLSRRIPAASFSISEVELSHLPKDQMIGDYSFGSYFQSLDTEENRRFIAAYQSRYGADLPVNNAMVNAYSGMYLWSRAAESANSIEANRVKRSLRGLSFKSPQGPVVVDGENHHLWNRILIAQVNDDSQYEILLATEVRIHPMSYPLYRSPDEWESFMSAKYREWGNQWSNPGISP